MLVPNDIIWKLILAAIVGGAVGVEREYRSKSAGFRTLTLICIGATIFTYLSEYIGGSGNPDRIASNIVTGIGFVGAGVIFKGDVHNRVNGITTAAMIWVTAALGMCIGAGYEWIAVIACALILIVLFAYSLLEVWIDKISQVKNYTIVCDFENETLHRYEELFRAHHLSFRRSRQTKSASNQITGEWTVKGSENNHRHCIHVILRDPTVISFEF